MLVGMRRAPWFFHPIAVFALSLTALVSSLFLYIYWYVEVRSGLMTLARRFDLDPVQVLTPETWVVIVVLSILVSIILLGIFIIFIYNQKSLQLYRLQSRFINNFTHELKTPVTSLQLFLETFLKYELPRPDQEKYIHYMLADVGRLSANISRILNLARLESKSYLAEFTATDLVQLVEQCLKENHALLAGSRIAIHDSGRQFIYPVDRSLFAMLVVNLLTNAIKYNEASTPQVDIHLSCTPRHLQMSFTDNGIGIDQKEARKIFRRFYQSGRPVQKHLISSGVGLNLVQNIAKIHHGRVEARRREEGTGSVFTILLPVEKLAAEDQGAAP
jgi:two-component system phosphate regulon sensor histidine kinase PhoR